MTTAQQLAEEAIGAFLETLIESGDFTAANINAAFAMFGYVRVAQALRSPLTESEIEKIARQNGDESDSGFSFNKGDWMSVLTFARDIERKHGILPGAADPYGY